MEFLYFLIPVVTIPILSVSCYCCIYNRVLGIESRLANLENRTTLIYHPPSSTPPYQPPPSVPIEDPSNQEWVVRAV